MAAQPPIKFDPADGIFKPFQTGDFVGVGQGGTGLTTVPANALIYANALDTLAPLAAGTNGHILTMVAGAPAWAAPAAAGVTGSGTLGKLAKWSGASALTDSLLTETANGINNSAAFGVAGYAAQAGTWTGSGWVRGIEMANISVVRFVKGAGSYSIGFAKSGDKLYLNIASTNEDAAGSTTFTAWVEPGLWTSSSFTKGFGLDAGAVLRWDASGGQSWGISATSGSFYILNSTANDASAAPGFRARFSTDRVAFGDTVDTAIAYRLSVRDDTGTGNKNVFAIDRLGSFNASDETRFDFTASTTPLARIASYYDSGSLWGLKFYTYNGGLGATPVLTLTTKAGINATAPARMLEVYETSGGYPWYQLRLTGGTGYAELGSDHANGYLWIKPSGQYIGIVNGSYWMHIRARGTSEGEIGANILWIVNAQGSGQQKTVMGAIAGSATTGYILPTFSSTNVQYLVFKTGADQVRGFIGNTGSGAFDISSGGGISQPILYWADSHKWLSEAGSTYFATLSSVGLLIGANASATRALEVRASATYQVRLYDISSGYCFDIGNVTSYILDVTGDHANYCALRIKRGATALGYIGNLSNSNHFEISSLTANLQLYAAANQAIELTNGQYGNVRILYGYGSGTYVKFEVDSAQDLLITSSNTATCDGIYNACGGFISTYTRTLAANVADSYVAGLRVDPGFTGGFTVDRLNYLDLQNASLAASAALTDACLFRADANAGTHKMVDGATTKTTPGGVDAWVKVNINGTIHFMPAYASKTA